MKAPLLAALALFPCLAFAQTSSTAPSADVAHQLEVITANLKLSPGQQDKLRPILVAEAAKKKTIEDNTTLTDKQKHDQEGAIHRAACQQMKKVFTPEQMAQIEQGQNHSTTSPTSPTTHAKPASPTGRGY